MTIYNTTDPQIISMYEDYQYFKTLYDQSTFLLNESLKTLKTSRITFKKVSSIQDRIIKNIHIDDIEKINCLIRKHFDDGLDCETIDNISCVCFSTYCIHTLKRRMKMILTIKYITYLDDVECPVCLEEETNVVQGHFKCCHGLCNKCYKLLHKKICPMCRSK